MLDAPAPPGSIQSRITEHASRLFSSLWPALEDESDARAVAARNGLSQRARREADELRTILQRQKRAIEQRASIVAQMELFAQADTNTDKEQQRQLKLDHDHMKKRYEAIDNELETEPAAVEALYEVRMPRLSPVGLVVTWPEAMT